MTEKPVGEVKVFTNERGQSTEQFQEENSGCQDQTHDNASLEKQLQAFRVGNEQWPEELEILQEVQIARCMGFSWLERGMKRELFRND
jgi:hypothetical protein